MRRLFFLLCVLWAVPASATTYYVSLSGSDSNSCATATTTTQANNKATIAAGVACATTAGDVVDIRGGTYTGSGATIDSQGHTVASGSSYGSAITIQGHSGETAIIKPPGGVSAVRIYGTATAYVIIQDLSIDMANNPGSNTEGIIIGGGPPYPNHIRVQRNNVYGGGGFGIHTGFGLSFLEFLNNSVHGFGTSSSIAGDAHGLYLSSSDMLVEGNDIYNNAGYGIHIWCSDDAPTHFCPGNVDPSRNVIRNNKVHHNGIGQGTNYGIVITWGTGNLVYNNLISYNKAGGQIYTGAVNTLWANNTIYGNTNEGLALQYYGTGTVIRNNIIYGNGQGIVDYSSFGYTADHNLTSDPSFTDSAGGDFTLRSTSAGINAGTTIGSFSTDFLGVSRPQGGTWDVGAYEFASASAPVITTTVLADGQRTSAYSQMACATGGTTPYTWSLASGTLPAGTALSTTTSICVTISGTLTTAASYTFTLRVTDNAAATDSHAYTVIVSDLTGTCSGGSGPWALIADTCVSAGSSNGTAAATTALVTTTGADIGFCAVADDKGQVRTPVTDSKSNTWTLVGSFTSEFGRVALYYSRYSSVGASHTFTADPGGVQSFPAIQCMSFSGSNASPLWDVAIGGQVMAGSAVQAGNVSIPRTFQIVVSAVNAEDANTLAASGFTVYQRAYSLNKYFGVVLGWQVHATAAADNPQWTWSSAMSASSVAGTFLASSSAFPGCTSCRLRFGR